MRISLFNEEQRLFDSTDFYVPKKDIQSYIENRSPYQTNEEICQVYESKGNILRMTK